jgi:hypothetical protein
MYGYLYSAAEDKYFNVQVEKEVVPAVQVDTTGDAF